MASKRITFSQLQTKFFELPRSQQEIFLKSIYGFSPENKQFFTSRLSEDSEVIKKEFINLLEKETFKRNKRFKKLRIASINKILKNAEKIPLPAIDMIDLYETAWKGGLHFLSNFDWYDYCPSRYEVSLSKYLEKYCEQLQEIAEREEREERKKETTNYLLTIFSNDYLRFPSMEEVYLEYLHNPKQ